MKRFAELVAGMAMFPVELRGVVEAATSEGLAFRPDERAWSIRGVLHHLADEEAEDFRPRLRATLDDPGAAWPPIDPEGWATARGYEAGDPFDALARFERERMDSIAWLRGLGEVAWTNAHDHPHLGPIRADELFCAWALHDRLHLAQIARRTAEFTRDLAGGVSCRYAEP